MKLMLAENAGYCFGVKLAVNAAEESAQKYGRIYTLGHIIHNKNVVSELEKKGVIAISSAADAPDGSTVMLRAHGVTNDETDLLTQKGCRIIDATCPFVKKIHNIVGEESRQSRKIIIAGKREHPEVIGIASRCKECVMVQNREELSKICAEWAEYDISMVAQTTFEKKEYEFFKKFIKKTCKYIRIFDTICFATELRQDEAALCASQADATVVVGDRGSSNTNNLFVICSSACPRTYFVESADELDIEQFDDTDEVFVTAGASTPDKIIQEVCMKMTEKIENIAAESFEELLEQSFKTLHTGEKVSGIVTQINNTDITVDLGVKQAGYIPLAELSDDPAFKLEESIKVGDQIEATVVRVNDVDGVVTLSKRRLDAVKNWEKLEGAVESKEPLEGIIVDQNKGGVVANVLGIRVFIPASQTGLPKDASFDAMMKTTHKIRITEVNRARRRVVGTIKELRNEARREAQAKIWETIAIGNKYEGVVKSFTSYGAFVDIGGVDGMVHISELSWSRVRHPSEVLAIGQTIEVFVIGLDTEKKKISLGYRKSEDDPWKLFTDKYSVGDVASVKIVKFMPFGAFAEVMENVDGLIHISQIANRRIEKAEDALTIGDVVDAKIVAIDEDKKKISLSIRALAETEAPAEEATADNE